MKIATYSLDRITGLDIVSSSVLVLLFILFYSCEKDSQNPTITVKSNVEFQAKVEIFWYPNERMFGGVVKYKQKGKISYPYWSLSNKRFIDYLVNCVGIGECKTYNLDISKWFNTLNRGYKLAVIRGIIDGDGCVYFQNNGYSHRILITSASIQFINMINEYFGNCGRIRTYRNNKSTVDTYDLSFNTRNSLILNDVFGNVTDIFLDRKLQKYLKIKEYYDNKLKKYV